ncbi:phosphoglucosamine mutase [Wenzhouxiangella sp. AB-CW3]|uniref:phosphoglucosamine mutase n=1 Tax=Wenzhouxiangella sp. AB-CW3 TaxID=2771012 RepID=UPI00168BE323|nr:phosphoglucosamine mutase [Wenzhouxiangella sp. AB-CW3]QOC23681.1 phosphoglucosamine mutase [Wenzhouxiangella sp. AB-CW3]
MAARYFGTDGIRGRVGEPPITADFVLRLGWAAGSVLTETFGEDVAVVIGKDTRISGYLFESALEAGFSAAGVDVLLLGPMPTPAVAHLTRSLHAVSGVVISASHNPFEDNGIKFFSGHGEKLDDELQEAIERKLDESMTHVEPHRLGKATRIDDAIGRYVEYCKGTVTWGTRLDDLRIVVDCANGATYRIAPDVFRELGAEVITIFDQPDGLNINRECGSTHPDNLARMVRAERADVGVAFDGDGDRVIMADAQGNLIDGDQILFVLADARRANGGLEGGVVGTVMSNFGLEQAFRESGIPFVRSPVGDRHVHQWLTERGWVLGGESSGHILCLDRATTGCGIVSALQVLEVLARSGRSLAELAAGMVKCPQVMINVPIASQRRAELTASPAIEDAVKRVESELAGDGRVILRPSGTEPVVRVTVEGMDGGQVDHLARELADVVRDSLAE